MWELKNMKRVGEIGNEKETYFNADSNDDGACNRCVRC